uniref:Glycosyl hydrolase n=1 Tax=Bursaphelenchus xylophilus TaxID=6326 RepID=A0A1I7SK17_BURXY
QGQENNYVPCVTDQGKTEKRFGYGVNPLLDGAWSLMPIRRVVDVFEKRG